MREFFSQLLVYRSNSLKSSNFYTYNLGGIAGGMVEVQMHGYRGGEGMISMVEKKGYNPQIFLVLDGLNEAKVNYIINNFSNLLVLLLLLLLYNIICSHRARRNINIYNI